MDEPARDVDLPKLESFLSAELDETVVDVEEVQRGINLTLSISTDRRPDAYILQRPGPERLRSDYFIGLDREHDILRALADADLAVPEPVLFCDEESVIGNPFLVTTTLDGTAIPWGSALPDRWRRADAREAVADRLIEALASVHSVAIDRMDGPCEQLTPAGQVERSLARLDRATAGMDHERPTLHAVGDWLRENAPTAGETALVHGDFKPDNVLLTGTDPIRIAGVIDWETARIGHPLVDLGFLFLFWREEADPTPSIADIESRYPGHEAIDEWRRTNEEGFWPFTSRPGSPTRRELVARYEEGTGRPFADERFFRALAPFTVATVWETHHRRQVDAGGDSYWGPSIEYMASIADSIVRGEFVL